MTWKRFKNWMSTYPERLWPPYYKYAVFLFLGFEFLYASFLLAISEAYYKSAALILPTAYQLFDYAISKNLSDFVWTEEDRNLLEMYKYKMMVLWVTSTVGILLCMVFIIPQFFSFNDKRGNPSHLCIVRHRLAVIMFAIVVVYVVALGCAVVWAWYNCELAVSTFRRKFDDASPAVEESFKSDLELKLECTTDDDKEVPDSHKCMQNIKVGFIDGVWMDVLLYSYIIGHVVTFLFIPCFNQLLIKPDEDEYYDPDAKELMDV